MLPPILNQGGLPPMFVRILTAAAALCFATAAHAQVVVWSSPGTACVPDDQTIKYDRYKGDIAFVQHSDKNKDPIVLNCPIAPFSSASSSFNLGITYRDSTGKNTQAVVRGRLYSMPRTAAATDVLAVVTSDTSAITTNNTLETTFTNTFDFDNFIYWVRIDIQRKSDSQTAIFHSAYINEFVP
jgi:hypothetical protein